jgi:type II secretion system protein N
MAAIAARPIPRPLLFVGVPVAGILLTVFFVFLGFPYDRLRESVGAELGRLAGAPVSIGELAPHLGLGGPGFEARQVATAIDGKPLRFDRVRLRPAWSPAWLSGTPALHVDADGPPGRVRGALVLGEERAWSGTLSGLDLELLPLEGLVSGLDVAGQVDAEADLRAGAQGLAGTLHFEAAKGQIVLPNLPMPLPFETLRGNVRFGEDGQLARVDALRLEGPIVSGDVEGTIGRGRIRGQEPLDLSVRMQVQGPAVSTIRSFGVPLDGNGETSLHLGGTLSNPVVR